MGLDSYLYADITARRSPLIPDFDRNTEILDALANVPPVAHTGGYTAVTATMTVGYWRKANHIHAWFVSLADGVDDCQQIPVSRTELKALDTTCAEVLRAGPSDTETAQSLLPPSPGFFFGATEIGEWYYDDCRMTRQICAWVDKYLPDSAMLIYQSSW